MSLFLYNLRCSSGRLNGGGEATFFLDILTSNFLCGFLCGLMASAYCTPLRFRQKKWSTNGMTTEKWIMQFRWVAEINRINEQQKKRNPAFLCHGKSPLSRVLYIFKIARLPPAPIAESHTCFQMFFSSDKDSHW